MESEVLVLCCPQDEAAGGCSAHNMWYYLTLRQVCSKDLILLPSVGATRLLGGEQGHLLLASPLFWMLLLLLLAQL